MILKIYFSGTNRSHHFPIFQIFESKLVPIPNEQKYVQYYDYCNYNIETFLETIDQELNSCTIDSFGTFC